MVEEARQIGVEALKALAHPLRARIFSEPELEPLVQGLRGHGQLAEPEVPNLTCLIHGSRIAAGARELRLLGFRLVRQASVFHPCVDSRVGADLIKGGAQRRPRRRGNCGIHVGCSLRFGGHQHTRGRAWRSGLYGDVLWGNCGKESPNDRDECSCTEQAEP